MPDITPVVTGFPPRVIAIVPDDDDLLVDYAGNPQPMQIQSVDGGDVSVLPLSNPDGQTFVFTLEAGEFVPCQVKKVLATNTTSSTIRGYF